MGNSCGASATATVVGGTGNYSATTTAPQYLTTPVSGNTVTITRNATGDPAASTTTPQTLNVTDGSSIVSVTLNNVALHCP